MLPFRIGRAEEATDGSPVLILLHGRGSDEADLQGIRSFLPSDLTFVTPRAPHPAAPWGYGPGWAWYRYLKEDLVDEATLAESLEALDAFRGGLPGEIGFEPGTTILGGFSQGGSTSLAYALTRPGSVGGVASFSGFLPAVPMVRNALDQARDLAVFWGHGLRDGNIPFALGVRGRKALSGAGARVVELDHPEGHTITAGELGRFRDWLEGELR